ncbi:MAG TPA: hypothetical protein VKD65_11500 [Candidatus Angelobacter sp.]|nr:hypothetical protein [Candidatus Angelobacter sp.]
MKKIGLTLFALTFLVSVSMAKDKASGAKATKISGWVTDANCAAKKDADLSNADCAKKCAEKGVKLVVVSDKDHSVLNVDNQDTLKGHEGHHVQVTGKLDNDTLHVDKVAMLKGGNKGKK